MTKQEIQSFIESRPAISKSALCREVGITRQYLNAILRESLPMTDNVAEKLLPVMQKYGWNQNE